MVDNMKKIGLIINPIAGMGGKVGLRGTDGRDILKKAVKLGASPEAPNKSLLALEKLLPIKKELCVLTSSNNMGENQCKELGLNYKVIYRTEKETTSSDTIKIAKIMKDMYVELIIFVGGDGTARDIYTAIELEVPVIGIPAGVKIYSPVYGNTPEKAGDLAYEYLTRKLPLKEEEVVDLDENSYRENIFNINLYGYLMVPYKEKFLQNKKAPTPLSEKETQIAIALDIIDNMEEDTFYIIGPGTTPRTIMEKLNLPNSLLGVDIIKNKEIVKLDCNEKEILEIIKDNKSKLVVTPTGGQGYLLGRGNQQLSFRVLRKVRKENIIIVATESKIIKLKGKPFLVYTGDLETDKYLSGYYRIKVGYGMENMYRVND